MYNFFENLNSNSENNMINNIKNNISNKINSKISHQSSLKSFNKYVDSLGNDIDKLNKFKQKCKYIVSAVQIIYICKKNKQN